MPFGAVGAVYSWDRVGFVLTFILSVLLLVPFSRFVDDIFAIVPEEDAFNVRLQMLEVSRLLGFVLELEKTPLPAPLQVVLGVEVLFKQKRCRGKSTFSIKVRLDPRKAEHWVSIMNEHLSSGTLSSEAAQKLAGRLGFVAFAVLGPLGASHVNHLYRRCYESREDMSADLEDEVRWWCNCLSRNKRVTIPLNPLGGGQLSFIRTLKVSVARGGSSPSAVVSNGSEDMSVHFSININ